MLNNIDRDTAPESESIPSKKIIPMIAKEKTTGFCPTESKAAEYTFLW